MPSKSAAPTYPALAVVQPAPVAVSVAQSAPRPRPAASRGSSAANQTTSPVRHSHYEALNNNGDRAPLPLTALLTPGVSSLLAGLQREQLVALSRHIADNYPLARYAVGLIKHYSVPINVTSASPNENWNTQADIWWRDLCTRIDFTGRFHFDTLQELWSQAIDTDGDTGITVTDLAGFPQVQTIDTRLLKEPNGQKLAWGGVQQDEFGRVVAYWLTPFTDPVPEPQFFLLYEPNNTGEYRGLPPMSLGSNDLRDAHEIKAFEKRSVKTRSAIVMGIETESGTVEENVWGDDEANEPAATDSTAAKKMSLAEFLGGDIPVIPTGSKLVAPDLGSRAGADWLEFQDCLVGYFCYALDIPPAFLLDAKLTGPNQRAVNDKVRKKFASRQKSITRAVTWVRTRCIAWAIKNGQLPPQIGWEKISTQGPPELSIDMSQQASDREAVKAGQMSLREQFGKRSLNAEREMNQCFKEAESIIQRCEKISGGDVTKFTALLARFLPSGSQVPIVPPTDQNAP